MVEKIIDGIEKTNCHILDKKNPSIILEIEKNYRILRRVYQSLYIDTADTFMQYIHSLEPDKIEQLDDDIKTDE